MDPDMSLSSIPLLHCRGSHYEVGKQIGQTFKTMIQDLLQSWAYFNDVVVKAGTTATGQVLFKDCLELCMQRYSGYVDEIRGMAHGAEIEFDKLFMLNIDSLLCTLEEVNGHEAVENAGGAGCTTIICNGNEIILGHTEDAMAEIKDHVYIISAEILTADGDRTLEKFTTLCYAGTLMGYTMGFNSEGMIYSVNTIFPAVYTAGTPRAFIARAALGASDLSELVNILRDKGTGIADGFSINVCFNGRGNEVSMYNIEVAPPRNSENMSVVNVHEIKSGSTYEHCNRYLRIDAKEVNGIAVKYSLKRSEAIARYQAPKTGEDVTEMLSDRTDSNYPIFNDGKENGEEYAMSFIRTVAVGIFDVNAKTWKVYSSRPSTGIPVQIINLQ